MKPVQARIEVLFDDEPGVRRGAEFQIGDYESKKAAISAIVKIILAKEFPRTIS